MDDEEFDRKVGEKVDELIELVEDHYDDKMVVNQIAALVDQVVARHRVTWFAAYSALAKVIARYGYQASVQCGEIKDEETADLFHQDGQVVLGYNSKSPDERKVQDNGDR